MARILRAVSSIAALRVTENGRVQTYHQPLPHDGTPRADKLVARLVKACPPNEGWIRHHVQTNPTGPTKVVYIGSICARRLDGDQLQLAHDTVVFTRAAGEDQATDSAWDILGKRFSTDAGWGQYSVIIKKV